MKKDDFIKKVNKFIKERNVNTSRVFSFYECNGKYKYNIVISYDTVSETIPFLYKKDLINWIDNLYLKN